MNDSLHVGSGYSFMTEMFNNTYKNPSFLGDGEEEARNPMTIQSFRAGIWSYQAGL